MEEVVKKAIPSNLLSQKTKYYINRTGKFVVGGILHGDCGLTGRKIIVDTYGGHGSHGGGHFPEKTLPRWTGARHILRGIAKNTLPRGLPPSARCSSPTP